MLVSDLDAGAALTTLVESVPCGVLSFDAKDEVTLASPPLASMLGIDLERLRELRTFDAIVAALTPNFSNAETVAARWRQHFAGGEAAWDELELVSPTRKILERFGRPVTGSNGRRIGWLEVYREVTGQRLMENRLFQNERLAALGQLVS